MAKTRIEWGTHSLLMLLRGWEGKYGIQVSVAADRSVVWKGANDRHFGKTVHRVCPPYPESLLNEFLKKNEFLSQYNHPAFWRESASFSIFLGHVSIIGPRLLMYPELFLNTPGVVEENTDNPRVCSMFEGAIFGFSQNHLDSFHLLEDASGEVHCVHFDTLEASHSWRSVQDFWSSTYEELNQNWTPGSEYIASWQTSQSG